jgi:hypothetical protein
MKIGVCRGDRNSERTRQATAIFGDGSSAELEARISIETFSSACLTLVVAAVVPDLSPQESFQHKGAWSYGGLTSVTYLAFDAMKIVHELQN